MGSLPLSDMAIGRTFLWSTSPHSFCNGPLAFTVSAVIPEGEREWAAIVVGVGHSCPTHQQISSPGKVSFVSQEGVVVYYSANISAFYYFATSNFFLLIYLSFRFSLLISSACHGGISAGPSHLTLGTPFIHNAHSRWRVIRSVFLFVIEGRYTHVHSPGSHRNNNN